MTTEEIYDLAQSITLKEFEGTMKGILNLNPREMELVIEALKEYYLRAIARAQKSRVIRPRKVNENLGFIQQTLQHIIIHHNLKTGKYYADSQASDSSGNQELAGDT